MNLIYVLPRTHSNSRRLLFLLGVAVAIIAGLLAMHVLSSNDVQVEPSTPLSAATYYHQMSVGAVADGEVVELVACSGDCGAQGNLPDHSMLMMVCILALLAAILLVLAPALLARLSMTLGVVVHSENARRALPHQRPPSLLVLSISRT